MLDFIKKYLVYLVVAFFAIVILVLYLTRPQANQRFTPPATKISVEVIKVQRENIKADIRSYGLVEPRISSKVVVQSSGRVVRVSEHFRDGGFFNKGDILLQIEKADYEIEVEIAKSNLAEAERKLQEEVAQSEQARMDWQRLGHEGTASPLVLREPQLEAAKANMRASAARLRQAELNLSRCDIVAPFDGRVLSKSVDLGQVVGGNSVIAEIYATDAVEIRLPIKNQELPLLNLPEAYVGDDFENRVLPSVEIISELTTDEIWAGKIVRTAGSIDSASRQLYVVARVEDPFGEKALGRFPLKIGQYVTAKIEGRMIEGAISIPNRTIYQGSYVYAYRDEAVYRQEIKIAWQNAEYAIVESGLEDGDAVVLTPLGQISSGTAVKVTNAESLGIVQAPEEPAWLKNIPPERLEQLKKEAEKAGVPFNEFMAKRRAERGRGAGK